MITAEHDTLKRTLKEVFGYDSFRGKQEEIISSVLEGNDTFVIMPTGAGKSMCYQLPAIISEGTAIVISPLIALMKNQVDQLNAFGVNARFLNSTLSKKEMNAVKKETISGEVKLLYVAPESLTKDENIAFLKQARISFVAVDEAHCISEWGHDFRPEYRRIKDIILQIGKVPVIALTATATPKVQLDIIRNLSIEDAWVFKSSFNRPNLYYEVRPKQQAKKQLIRFVKEHKGKSGIVYCLSRKKVEEIAELLKVNDVRAAPYHAGLEAATRVKNQDDFLNEEVDVIVATIAFGMGIDKPDVRFVVHFDTPKSLEGYYQETGRAGRDGLEGMCIMFYSYNDILKLEKFNKDKSVTERENSRILLDEMAAYAESAVCRRKQLLHYFGESYQEEGHCGKTMWCDICRYPVEKFEGRSFVETILKAVKGTEQRFGMTHLVNVIRGSEDQYVRSYDHDKLDVFGSGKEESDEFWKSVIRQALLHEYLYKDIENIGVLKLSDKGNDFISHPHSIKLTKNKDFTAANEDDEIDKDPVNSAAYDDKLYEILKSLRKKVARQKGLPPYVIFQDPSLEEMATVYPTTNDELVQINGVGRGKVAKFGAPFLEVIKNYVEENEIVTASDVLVKTSAQRSKNKVYIIQQIDRKVDLEEIAETKNMSLDEIIEEIEQINNSGTKLNLDYYINQILEEDKQEEIMDYFLQAETDNIQEAVDEFEGYYSEEDLRLMRIKFMSEHAH